MLVGTYLDLAEGNSHGTIISIDKFLEFGCPVRCGFHLAVVVVLIHVSGRIDVAIFHYIVIAVSCQCLSLEFFQQGDDVCGLTFLVSLHHGRARRLAESYPIEVSIDLIRRIRIGNQHVLAVWGAESDGISIDFIACGSLDLE